MSHPTAVYVQCISESNAIFRQTHSKTPFSYEKWCFFIPLPACIKNYKKRFCSLFRIVIYSDLRIEEYEIMFFAKKIPHYMFI